MPAVRAYASAAVFAALFDFSAPVQVQIQVLIVVPSPLSDTGCSAFKERFGPDAIAKSKALAAQFRQAGRSFGVTVFDALSVVQLDGIDGMLGGIEGLHLSERTHNRLGLAMAKEPRKAHAAKGQPAA